MTLETGEVHVFVLGQAKPKLEHGLKLIHFTGCLFHAWTVHHPDLERGRADHLAGCSGRTSSPGGWPRLLEHAQAAKRQGQLEGKGFGKLPQVLGDHGWLSLIPSRNASSFPQRGRRGRRGQYVRNRVGFAARPGKKDTPLTPLTRCGDQGGGFRVVHAKPTRFRDARPADQRTA